MFETLQSRGLCLQCTAPSASDGGLCWASEYQNCHGHWSVRPSPAGWVGILIIIHL